VWRNVISSILIVDDFFIYINVLSGVLILIRKAVWKKIGGFVEKQLLSVDNNLHWALMDKKEKLYLMKGVYLYHWYRGGDIGDDKHLKL